jgi:hypothetical protein
VILRRVLFFEARKLSSHAPDEVSPVQDWNRQTHDLLNRNKGVRNQEKLSYFNGCILIHLWRHKYKNLSVQNSFRHNFSRSGIQSSTSLAPVRYQSGTSPAPVRHQSGTRPAPVRHQSGTNIVFTCLAPVRSSVRLPVRHSVSL